MIETVREQRIRERRRILIALAISVLVHLLLIGIALLALIVMAILNPPRALEPESGPVELILLPSPSPKEEERPFIDSAQTEPAEEAPEKAQFESDENSRAASELPPTSDERMPSVDGDSEDGLTLRNQQLALGPSNRPSPPSPPQQEQSPAVEQQPPQPREEQKEEPTPTPAPTPSKDDLAVPARPKPREEPEVRKPEPPTPPTVPRAPGFQPQTRTTRLTGGVSNRGRASVDAVGTPLGRYRKMLNDAIGSRWYYYVSDMIGMVNIGTVHITFVVRADGKVEKWRVTKNTSNETLASCSTRAILEAEIPPIPREIADALEGGQLEVDFSFTILP